MAILTDAYNLIYDAKYSTLRARVIAAVANAAYGVLNEPSSTPNYVKRLAWAKETLTTPEALKAAGERLYFGTVIDPAVQDAALADTVKDADIQAAINARINSDYAAGS